MIVETFNIVGGAGADSVLYICMGVETTPKALLAVVLKK
jgi:hypothetical protein